MQNSKYAILIAGPTASGKSALATALARDLGGVVINADSMQVYKDLSIITARPSAEEMGDIPHELYGTVDGATAWSAADWAEAAMSVTERVWGQGKLPILIGGTGMYFKFLLDGVAAIPDIPADIRAAVRAEVDEGGAPAAHKRLEVLDPVAAARLEPNDSQRIARALEVEQATGRTLSEWHTDNQEGPLTALNQDGHVIKLVLDIPRDQLYARCDQRFDLMIEAGTLDEIAKLSERGLDASLPVMKSLGVPELMAHMRGDMTLMEAVDTAKMHTRRFAKRQLTWFKNQFPDWNRLSAQYSESEYQYILQFITKKVLTK